MNASIYTPPNGLTLLRIIAGPVSVWFYFYPITSDCVWWLLLAPAIYAGGAITDWLDGQLARKHKWETEFGKKLDTRTDKWFIGWALVALSINGELWWWVTVVIMAREFGVTFLKHRLLKSMGVSIPTTQLARWKAVIQMTAITLYFVPAKLILETHYLTLDQWNLGCGLFMFVALVLTIWTGLTYLKEALLIWTMDHVA
jgi:CDP-diacylglycerol---glycerol-3-phosphate 3-phosphatidyltransferase